MQSPFPKITERLLPKYLDTPPTPYSKPFEYISKDSNYVPMPTYQEKWEPSKEGKKYYADLEKEIKKFPNKMFGHITCYSSEFKTTKFDEFLHFPLNETEWGYNICFDLSIPCLFTKRLLRIKQINILIPMNLVLAIFLYITNSKLIPFSTFL